MSDGLFCQACLSSDRNLSSVGEYVDVFKNISNNILPQPLLLCWECMAILRKIKLFQDKLEKAQQIITDHYENKQKLLLQTLSKLTNTYTAHSINIITHDEDDDCKQNIEIKLEHELSNDSFNHFDKNDFCPQEIQEENVEDRSRETVKIAKKNKAITENVEDPKVKQYPCRKKSIHYRIVYEKVLTKKVAIQPEESKIWIVREINSDFYKKLRYTCKLCVRAFNIKEKLESHVLKYHDESAGSHVCPICNIRFISESLLRAHTQAHEFAWECVHCGFQCYSVERLNAHINTHRAIQCVYCEAKFEDLKTFQIHNNTFHRIFICDYCGKRCRTKYMIEKHMRRHLERHVCPTCSRHYKTRESLKTHISERHRGGAPEQAYCVLCDKKYASGSAYRRHVNTSAAHMEESQFKNRFTCPECSNTYSRRVSMMNHYRHVHKNQSKHYCSECHRHFLNRTRYLEHMRYKHEGVKKEKNKLCNFCGRGFAHKTTLLNHIRTHTGERPYECEHCAAKFTQRYAMLTHVKFIHMKSKRKPQ